MKGGRKMPAGRTGGFLAVAALLLVACQATTGAVYREPGLVTGKPGRNVYPGGDPGETSPLARPYPIAPPLIPHRVDDAAIDRENNGCLDCHLTGEEVAQGHRATKVPPSHFRNEHTGEEKSGEVAGIRYQCTLCHVPQASSRPPVPQMAR